MFAQRGSSYRGHFGCVSLTLILLISTGLRADDSAVETAPEFTAPPLSPSLLDFVTGMPVAYNTKVMMTPELLRPPFAGEAVDTAKGLASKIKAQQIDAKNRVKAAKFLGSVDCIAYPEAQQQLVGLVTEDPVEEVRYAAAKALKEQFSHGKARHPSGKDKRKFDTCRGCCGNQEVMNTLAARANEIGDAGCPLEPSERVRKVLSEALAECCPQCWSCMNQSAEQDLTPVPEQEKEEQQSTPGKEERTPGTEQKKDTQVVPPKPTPPTEEEPGKQTQLPLLQSAQAALTTKSSLIRTTASCDGKPIIHPISSTALASTNATADVPCLRGYCPVALLEGKLIPARKEFAFSYQNHIFHFSSAEAKKAFEATPAKYAPILAGVDFILHEMENKDVTGNYFTIYKGHPYWFATKQNRSDFEQNPQKYLNARNRTRVRQ